MQEMSELERASGYFDAGANRLFYLAIPPTQFVAVAGPIKRAGESPHGW